MARSDGIADGGLRTRLPVGATIVMTWRFLLRSAGTYLLQTIIWTFVLIAIVFGAVFALVFLLSPLMPGIVLSTMYGAIVIMAVLFAPMAVECHRAVLLEERPSVGRMFRFDRRAARLIAVGLLCMHVTMWPFLLALPLAAAPYVGAATSPETYYRIAGGLIIVGLIWTPSTAPALILSLAMCSVDRPRPVLRQAWRLSRGNRFRILCVMVAAVLPVVGLYALLIVAVLGIASPAAGVASNFISTVLQFAALLTIMTAAACAYGRLSGEHSESVYRVFD